MKKSTVVAVLLAVLLLAALAVSFNAVRASRSYLACASRLASEAPPGDRSPPESFRRLSRELMPRRDLYISGVLARECAKELGTAPRGFGRRMALLGALKAQLSSDQRESLAAILIAGRGGRGLTHSALTEWGRPPEALTDAEMIWLFVVGTNPNCSRAGVVPERDKEFCSHNYELRLSRLRRQAPAGP